MEDVNLSGFCSCARTAASRKVVDESSDGLSSTRVMSFLTFYRRGEDVNGGYKGMVIDTLRKERKNNIFCFEKREMSADGQIVKVERKIVTPVNQDNKSYYAGKTV